MTLMGIVLGFCALVVDSPSQNTIYLALWRLEALDRFYWCVVSFSPIRRAELHLKECHDTISHVLKDGPGFHTAKHRSSRCLISLILSTEKLTNTRATGHDGHHLSCHGIPHGLRSARDILGPTSFQIWPARCGYVGQLWRHP
jgi:hypothetical protein